MKPTSILFLSILFFTSLSQAQTTKILDSKVDWATHQLTVYLSDSLITQAVVTLGISYGANDVLNTTYSVGAIADVTVNDNILVIPFPGNITPGEYYVKILLTAGNSFPEMEFQLSN